MRLRPGFVKVPAGAFVMGASDGPHHEDGEGPVREVTLSSFAIRATTVTNSDFERFVDATGYVTLAERSGRSQVFQGQLEAPEAYPSASSVTPWWRLVDGACWHKPNGFNAARSDFPVVHIAHEDAQAFCTWAGTRLPTEAEWERAAQDSELDGIRIWSGQFPNEPAGAVGPVNAASGSPNAAGLHHACGNVWEWTADRFTNLHSPRAMRNPKGPLNGSNRVVKGGSFLCCPSYCKRFRPSSRRAETPRATTSHLGFRDVLLP